VGAFGGFGHSGSGKQQDCGIGTAANAARGSGAGASRLAAAAGARSVIPWVVSVSRLPNVAIHQL